MPQDQHPNDPPNVATPTDQFGFWELDLHEMALGLSDTACAIYSIGAGRCNLDDFLERVHPDELKRVRDTVHAALRARARLDVGYRIVPASGAARQVRVRAELLHAGDGTARYVGTVQDVTGQLQRERKSEFDARLLEIASAVAHIGGWTYDLAQGRVVWSDEVCRIHEVPPGTAPHGGRSTRLFRTAIARPAAQPGRCLPARRHALR